jgi:hypothetical protein
VHLFIVVLSPFFLDSLASRIPEDIMGKDRINTFLHIELTVSTGWDIFDL